VSKLEPQDLEIGGTWLKPAPKALAKN
jgi:hypothetical protein